MNAASSLIIDHLQQRRYKQAELAAKELIRMNPLIAQHWMFLGEALLHQGCALAAKKVFERAWLLDPEATWVKRVFDQAIPAAPAGDERFDIEGLLHVGRVTVTAGILTHNNEDTIERCLASLQGAVDEIVLVDSSTDRTAALASAYPNVRIIPYEWCDDFSAARNAGLTHMRTDWVFWIDADEVLVEEDRDAVKLAAGLFHDYPLPPILSMWQLNRIEGRVLHNFSQSRLFPLNRGIRYWGNIHEQAGTASGMYGSDTYRHKVKIRVLHDGYEPGIIAKRNKLERNLKLLRSMIESEPDEPAWRYYYGRELLGRGDEEQALEALLVAERKAQLQPRFGRTLEIYKLLLQIYDKRKDWNRAIEMCEKALKDEPDYPDAHFMLAQIRMKQADEWYRQAEAGLRRARKSLHTFRHAVTPDHEIGEWKTELALAELARKSGQLAAARDMYRRVVQRHPRMHQAVKRLAAIEEERRRLNEPPDQT